MGELPAIMHFIILVCGIFLVIIISIYYLKSITRLTEYESRLKALNRLVKKNRTPSAYIARADFYFMHNEFNMALFNYDKAIELAPTELEGYMKKIDTLKKMEKESELEELYRVMIENSAIKSNALILRAFYHLRTESYLEAYTDYEQARDFKLNKIQNRDYFIIKGIYNYHLGDSKKAIENFNEAINVINYMSSPYLLKYVIFKNEGRQNRVLSNFNQFKINCEESKYNHYLLRGDYFAGIGEIEQAIENYLRPLDERLKEDEPHKYFYGKAQAARLQAQDKEAAKYFDSLIEADYPEIIKGILDVYLYHIFKARSLAYFNSKEMALNELSILEDKPDYYHTLKLYLDDVRKEINAPQ